MPTLTAVIAEPARLAQPGEALARRAVTVITAAIVVMTFAFSLGNVTRLLVTWNHDGVSPCDRLDRAVASPQADGTGVCGGWMLS